MLGDSGLICFKDYLYFKGVGKSSLLLRFIADEFQENMETTLGAAFRSKIWEYKEAEIKFQVITDIKVMKILDLRHSRLRKV